MNLTFGPLIGEGAYGKVYEIKDSQGKQNLAIKIVPYDPLKSGIPQNCLRESSVLMNLPPHKNIIEIVSIIPFIECPLPHFGFILPLLSQKPFQGKPMYSSKQIPKNILQERPFKHNYIPLVEIQELELSNSSDIENTDILDAKQPFKDYLYQLLQALSHLHNNNYMHRDIKPSNILYKGNSPIICDFSLVKPLNSHLLTRDAQTWFYKAPEVLLSSMYNSKIDIWSLGCVFYEYVMKKKLFVEETQTGLFHSQLKMGIGSLKGFETYLEKDMHWLLEIEPYIGNEGCQVLESMLTLDYEQRKSADQLLESIWFDDLK